MWGCYILCPPPRTGDAAWAAPDRHAAPRHAPWGHEHRGLVLLARRQEHHHGLAPVLATKVHLGTCPASPPTYRFRCRVPFFPPAACGWARITRHGMPRCHRHDVGPVQLALGIHGLLEGGQHPVPDAPLVPVPEPAVDPCPRDRSAPREGPARGRRCGSRGMECREDAVQDGAIIFAWPPLLGVGRRVWCNLLPLRIGIISSAHVHNLP